MSKTVEQQTQHAADVRDIEWDRLIPSKHNKRRWMKDDSKDPEIIELAQSIEAHGGNFQNVVTRVHPEQPENFEIAAGERRWRAVRLSATAKNPKWRVAGARPVTKVRCDVRELTHAQAFTITMDENKKRKNLSPLEEADTIQDYLDTNKNWTVEQVADALNMSVKSAYRRLQLRNLSPKWQEALDSREHSVCNWSAQHLEIVAARPQNIQDSFLDQIDDYDGGMTVATLRGELARLFAFLGDAPWKLDDELLVRSAGPCANCQKRTSCQPNLFDEEDFEGFNGKAREGDRCLDLECFNEKLSAHSVRIEAQVRAKHPNLVLVEKCGGGARKTPWKDSVKTIYHYSPAKASDKGAFPALVVGEGMTGKVIYLKSDGYSGGSGGSSRAKVPGVVKTLAERRADLEKARAKLVCQYLLEKIEAWIEAETNPFTENHSSLNFVYGFGTSGNGRDIFNRSTTPWQDLEEHRDSPVHKVITDLVVSSLNVAASRFRSLLNFSGANFLDEAKAGCACFNISFDDLWARATEERKQPKSWAGLNEDGTPKGDAKAPKEPTPGKPVKGVCRVCGCTEDTPCVDRSGDGCSWKDKSQTLCTNPECIKKDRADTLALVNAKGGKKRSGGKAAA